MARREKSLSGLLGKRKGGSRRKVRKIRGFVRGRIGRGAKLAGRARAVTAQKRGKSGRGEMLPYGEFEIRRVGGKRRPGPGRGACDCGCAKRLQRVAQP